MPSAWAGESTQWIDDGREPKLTFSGVVNPNGSQTTCVFEYGIGESYDRVVPCQEEPGAGTSEVRVEAEVSEELPTPGPGPNFFRLVATNVNGTSTSSAVAIGTAFVDRVGPPTGPRGRPAVGPTTGPRGKPVVGERVAIRDGIAQVTVSCLGTAILHRNCVGDVRLIARKKKTPRGAVETVRLGKGSYELAPGKRRIVPIVYPKASRHLLRRSENLVHFVLDGPELTRRVVEFTTVDFE